MSRVDAVTCDRCKKSEVVKVQREGDLPPNWRHLEWSRADTTFGDAHFDLCPACVEHITQALWPEKKS